MEGIFAIIGLFILPAIAILVIGTLYVIGRHEERMSMIEHGVTLEQPKKKPVSLSRSLCNGLVLIGLALGLIAGVCVRPYVEDGEWLIPGFIMLGGGLGFVVYYLIAFKLRKKDGSEEDIA